MTDPLVNDVFRFLAVRPPELVTETEAKSKMITDSRADSNEGRRELQSEIKHLTDSATSQRRWDATNKDIVILLFQLHSDLMVHYRKLRKEWVDVDRTPPPDAAELIENLSENGAQTLGDIEESSLWDLLYLAFSTGCDSGEKVAYPMAALRLYRFYINSRTDPNPTPRDALEILDRIILLPTLYADEFASASEAREVDEQDDESDRFQSKVNRDSIVTLAHDLVAVRQLLDKVKDATVAGRPDVLKREGPSSEWDIRVEGTTLTRASEVIPEKLTPSQARVLEGLGIDADTSSIDLHKKLTDQSRELAQAAELVQNSPVFQSTYQQQLTKSSSSVVLSSGQTISIPFSYIGPVIELDIGAEDMSKMIRPLGVGDLLVVKQTLLAYVAGEVSHIENVLNGEEKTRNHRRLDRTEVTIFEATEENRESERDVQSTDRFELQNEASTTIQSETSFGVGVSVTGKYGPVETTVTGNFATKNSKEESTKNSSKFSKEVVDKSVDKIQNKVRSERTTKTITEVEEINIHTLKGMKADGHHTVGVYRWVDKKYHAQIYNYGPRLLLEFVIPEPANYYRTSWTVKKEEDLGVKPPPELRNYYDTGGNPMMPDDVLAPAHISEENYTKYAGMFGVTDVEPIPPVFSSVSTTLATLQPLNKGVSFALKGDDKFIVPDGYSLIAISYAVSATTATWPTLYLHILGRLIKVSDDESGSGPGSYGGAGTKKSESILPDTNEIRDAGEPSYDDLTKITGVTVIPTGMTGYDIYAASATIVAYCKRTHRAEQVWQQNIYNAIVAAWQAQKTVYDQAVKDAHQKDETAQIFQEQGQNLEINKKILENELKKHCITMMTGTDKNTAGAISTQSPPRLQPHAALRDGRISQFFEQAFEWDQMTYLFYPYYWGKKSRWNQYQSITDADPLFQGFLTAGAARVVVPVPLAYMNDVYYLLTNPHNEKSLSKKVWRGGDLPYLNDPMYRSLADELRQQTDDLHGGTADGIPWEFKLPTTLVWLQQDDSMPIEMDK